MIIWDLKKIVLNSIFLSPVSYLLSYTLSIPLEFFSCQPLKQDFDTIVIKFDHHDWIQFSTTEETR